MWLADMFTGRKQNRFVDLFDQLSDKLVKAATLLEQYVAQGKPEISDEIDRLEKQADEILRSILTSLTEAFITPYDRQDIFYLAEDIDDMIDYINNAAREIKLFGVAVTPPMAEMARILTQGANEVRAAVAAIATNPNVAAHHARAASATENAMEDLYRRSLAELFETPDIRTIFKLREIYRHLNNCADRADAAAKQIDKIVIKIA